MITSQLGLFGELPPLKDVARRRISRRGPRCGTLRRERIDKRNRTIVARYYYWTELKRRRFDDVLQMMSDNEFFVEERTISNALLNNDELLHQMMSESWTAAKLRGEYPGWDWN